MTTPPSGTGTAGRYPASPGATRLTGRGFYRYLSIVTLFMMVIGGFAIVPSAASAASTQTIDDLNLRAEPALNATILDVMPSGSAVEIVGDPVDGFYLVSYEGQTGYAYGDYLSVGGTGNGAVTTGGDMSEVNVVAGPVNFRTGPSEDDGIISVIPDGALVALTGDSIDGFYGIIYTDRPGWAYGDFIFGTSGDTEDAVPVEEPAVPEAPDDSDEPVVDETVPAGDTVTGSATVVDGALNLRSGPGGDYAVVATLPDGAAVELLGAAQGNFQPLRFDGVTGWASADFLVVDDDEVAAPEAPAPPAAEPAPTDVPAPPAAEPEPTDEPAPPAEEPEPTEVPAPPAEEPAPAPSDETGIVGIINNAADEYGQSREDMLRVATCESNLDPNAVNPSSNASGLFQFLPSTFATTPYADEDIFDPVANARAAGWMWANGRRNEWVCQ